MVSPNLHFRNANDISDGVCEAVGRRNRSRVVEVSAYDLSGGRTEHLQSRILSGESPISRRGTPIQPTIYRKMDAPGIH
jgi:hypothetical protein